MFFNLKFYAAIQHLSNMVPGYKSLRALQFRTGDKVASAFIKKVSKRLIEPKGKANTSIGKSNDDKARSKSPNMRERLKLS